MPRRAAIVPNTHLHTTLPPALAGKLAIHLYSEVEGGVPRGAYQAFLTTRIAEFFETKRVDLSPYLNTPIGEVVVSGTPLAIDKLTTRLKEAPQVRPCILDAANGEGDHAALS